VRAFRPIPPPRLCGACQHTLEHLRLGSVQVGVRVQCSVDHRTERRRPRWAHRIAPAAPTGAPLTTDYLAAPARAPRLGVIQVNAPDSVTDLSRALERREFRRGVDVSVSSTAPADSLLRSRSGMRGHLEGRLIGMAAPPQPICDRSARTGSQTASFRCAAFRTSAQPFSLRSAISRAPSYLLCGVEAAGIEPASADAPNRASTSVVRLESHPTAGGGRPTGGPAILWVSRLGRWSFPWRRARWLTPRLASGPARRGVGYLLSDD
jgi:hypothetical protein